MKSKPKSIQKSKDNIDPLTDRIHPNKNRMSMKELTKNMTPEGVSSQFLDWDDIGLEIIE